MKFLNKYQEKIQKRKEKNSMDHVCDHQRHQHKKVSNSLINSSTYYQ